MTLSTGNTLEEATLRSRKLIDLYQVRQAYVNKMFCLQFDLELKEAGHKPSLGRSIIGLVLLLISLKNLDEAEKVARALGNYCNNEQTAVLGDLLDGYEKEDFDMVRVPEPEVTM